MPMTQVVKQSLAQVAILGIQPLGDLALGALGCLQKLAKWGLLDGRPTQKRIAPQKRNEAQEALFRRQILQPKQLIRRLPMALGVQARLAIVRDDDPARLFGLVGIVPALLDRCQRASFGVFQKLRRAFELDGRDHRAGWLGGLARRPIRRQRKDPQRRISPSTARRHLGPQVEAARVRLHHAAISQDVAKHPAQKLPMQRRLAQLIQRPARKQVNPAGDRRLMGPKQGRVESLSAVFDEPGVEQGKVVIAGHGQAGIAKLSARRASHHGRDGRRVSTPRSSLVPLLRAATHPGGASLRDPAEPQKRPRAPDIQPALALIGDGELLHVLQHRFAGVLHRYLGPMLNQRRAKRCACPYA